MLHSTDDVKYQPPEFELILVNENRNKIVDIKNRTKSELTALLRLEEILELRKGEGGSIGLAHMTNY